MSVTTETFDDQVCATCEDEGYDGLVTITAGVEWILPTAYYAVGRNDSECYVRGPGRCSRGHEVPEYRVTELIDCYEMND